EVVRGLDAVEGEEEGGLGAGQGDGQELGQVDRLDGGHDGEDALVGAAAGLGLDQGAGDGLDLDPAVAGEVEEVAEGGPAGAGGDQDPVHGAAGAEGLDDRAAARDQPPPLAGADGLPGRLQLVAAAGLLGPAGARGAAAPLPRGPGAAAPPPPPAFPGGRGRGAPAVAPPAARAGATSLAAAA